MAHGDKAPTGFPGPAQRQPSGVVTIPESSAQLGHYGLLVVVSEIGREELAPRPLQLISLDDRRPHLR
jgi:hypothetical protein